MRRPRADVIARVGFDISSSDEEAVAAAAAVGGSDDKVVTAAGRSGGSVVGNGEGNDDRREDGEDDGCCQGRRVSAATLWRASGRGRRPSGARDHVVYGVGSTASGGPRTAQGHARSGADTATVMSQPDGGSGGQGRRRQRAPAPGGRRPPRRSAAGKPKPANEGERGEGGRGERWRRLVVEGNGKQTQYARDGARRELPCLGSGKRWVGVAGSHAQQRPTLLIFPQYERLGGR